MIRNILCLNFSLTSTTYKTLADENGMPFASAMLAIDASETELIWAPGSTTVAAWTGKFMMTPGPHEESVELWNAIAILNRQLISIKMY